MWLGVYVSSRSLLLGFGRQVAEAAVFLMQSSLTHPTLNKFIMTSSTLYGNHSDKNVYLMDNFL